MARQVRFPETAHDWQLYTSEGYLGRANKAAKSLSSALKKAAKACTPDPKTGGVKLGVYQAYSKYVAPVMSKHADVGAADTEPRGVAADYLESVSGKEF